MRQPDKPEGYTGCSRTVILDIGYRARLIQELSKCQLSARVELQKIVVPTKVYITTGPGKNYDKPRYHQAMDDGFQEGLLTRTAFGMPVVQSVSPAGRARTNRAHPLACFESHGTHLACRARAIT